MHATVYRKLFCCHAHFIARSTRRALFDDAIDFLSLDFARATTKIDPIIIVYIASSQSIDICAEMARNGVHRMLEIAKEGQRRNIGI